MPSSCLRKAAVVGVAVLLALLLAGTAEAASVRLRFAAQPSTQAPPVAVSETDPSRYSPQRLSLDGQGRPVYPLPRSVPTYPNRLQLDRDGRVVYPSPERTAAAVAPSFVEKEEAKAAPAKEEPQAAAVSETDPSRYSPQRLAVDGQGRPVYPLPRSVPTYPNRLQLARDGRVLYPSPERTAAAVAPSFVEQVAGSVGGLNNPTFSMPGGAARSVYLLPQYLGDRVTPYVAPPAVLRAPEAVFTPPMGVAESGRRLPFELRNTNLFVPPGMNVPTGTFAFVEEAAAAAAVFRPSSCSGCSFYE